MRRLGIGDDALVVTYDDMGVPLASARLWWTLSSYRHERVRELDGGLRQWRALGYPSSTAVPVVLPAGFTACVRPGWIASREDAIAALQKPEVLILDCLTPERYRGKAAHPRSGHIPGAINVPYPATIDPALSTLTTAELETWLDTADAFTLAPRATLGELYRQAGVRADREVITDCGRGYAGACGVLALKCPGHDHMLLDAGSWLEWTTDPRLPVETARRQGAG